MQTHHKWHFDPPWPYPKPSWRLQETERQTNRQTLTIWINPEPQVKLFITFLCEEVWETPNLAKFLPIHCVRDKYEILQVRWQHFLNKNNGWLCLVPSVNNYSKYFRSLAATITSRWLSTSTRRKFKDPSSKGGQLSCMTSSARNPMNRESMSLKINAKYFPFSPPSSAP